MSQGMPSLLFLGDVILKCVVLAMAFTADFKLGHYMKIVSTFSVLCCLLTRYSHQEQCSALRYVVSAIGISCWCDNDLNRYWQQ